MGIIKKILPEVKENVSLNSQTTFKIGGPAKYFFVAKDKKGIIKAIKAAKEFKLPFFILGSGSNVLVSDKGYDGLVIKMQNPEIKVQGINICADAGALVRKVTDVAVENNLTGFEWASGIPGTIGAAIYGNIGAFGSTMAGNIKSVEFVDIRNWKIKRCTIKECKFDNKNSIFKVNKNLIILSAIIKLEKGEREEISREIKRFLEYRKNNHPLEFPSAGCVFKNYDKKITNKNLLKKYPELIEFNKGSRIPTSYLIDKAGLKGKTIGGAKISEKHANFIINTGAAKAEDVVKLIKIMKKGVKNKFGIVLQEEIQHLPSR
ncbi:MAG: UDP-N-acetylmuramate dehydrogenase [Candidatus Staskawiczbacteria bacterium]|jgi:UDP-N-acetylmuramate dehydrogenase